MPRSNAQESLKDTQGHQTVANDQTGCDNTDHAHQLDEDIQARSTRILKGIPDRVTDNRRFVGIRSLAAMSSRLNVFFGVIPGAPCVGHKNGNAETTGECADQQSHHPTYTQ